MKNSWLSLRKDFFLRDLFRDFFEAKKNFEKIHLKYQGLSFVPFKSMDTWVGTETKKGSLWNLKDLSHQLFRNNLKKNSLYENLFDWTISSIFHEAIKLKEDSYQIESYKPLLDMEIGNYKKDPRLSKIINEYFVLIQKANKNLKDDIFSIEDLFSQALFHLKEIALSYRHNTLLVRYWLDSKKIIETQYGKNSFNKILKQMFPEGIHEAYIQVSEQCIVNGRTEDAQLYLKKALSLDQKNKRAEKLHSKLKNRKTIE